MRRIRWRVLHAENVIHHRLVVHSAVVLRIAVGAVFLAFGLLKFFPGASPAENLTKTTTELLSFGLVPGGVSIVAIAMLESFIGAALISGRCMRPTIWLLAIEFVGILAPLALLPGRLFAGPHGAPTLEGQYVLKDVVLVAAGMVIAATSFRGGRIVRGDLPPLGAARRQAPLDGRQKLRVVLAGGEDPQQIAALSERHGISQAQLHAWRRVAHDAAARALAEQAAAGTPPASRQRHGG